MQLALSSKHNILQHCGNYGVIFSMYWFIYCLQIVVLLYMYSNLQYYTLRSLSLLKFSLWHHGWRNEDKNHGGTTLYKWKNVVFVSNLKHSLPSVPRLSRGESLLFDAYI